ncbi:MAG TPA: response regulator [Nitrososphaeraceae archaeon]
MILIVDDDYDIACLIKISLEKIGLRASLFTDPLVALDEFSSHAADYNLIISDIRMPGISGYELAYRLEKIKPDVKIFLMSAFEYSSRIFEKYLSHISIAGFLEKPIPISELWAAVSAILDNKPLQYGLHVHLA